MGSKLGANILNTYNIQLVYIFGESEPKLQFLSCQKVANYGAQKLDQLTAKTTSLLEILYKPAKKSLVLAVYIYVKGQPEHKMAAFIPYYKYVIMMN